eukprot:3637399-Rhodomonas_salina.1
MIRVCVEEICESGPRFGRWDLVDGEQRGAEGARIGFRSLEPGVGDHVLWVRAEVLEEHHLGLVLPAPSTGPAEPVSVPVE